MKVALVRAVPDSFVNAIVLGERPTIDLDRARSQHAMYRQVLERHGYEVRIVPADEAHPDCPFVEDAAVVLDTVAVATRPGAAARRGEVAAVTAELGHLKPMRTIEAPGTLDGGDVLRMGDTLYVGRSTRTNDAGIEQLATHAMEDGLRTVAVPVRGVLHLKSAVAQLDDSTLLVALQCVDVDLLTDYRIVEKVTGEEHLASVLRLGSGRLVTTTTAPRTRQLLREHGYVTEVVDSSEFQAADGGLTCLSILVED
jgi:dimethylargininase